MGDPIALAQLGLVAACLGVVAFVILRRTVGDPRFSAVALLWARGVLPAIIGVAWAFNTFVLESIVWIGRVATLFLLLAIVVGVLQAFSNGLTSIREGRTLWLAGLAFTLTAIVSEFAVDDLGSRTWLGAVGLTGTYLAVVRPPWLLLQLKRVTAIYILGSAAVALVAPAAWVPHETTLIGIDVRINGLMPHPNGLAPFMLLYLLLERVNPSVAWIRWGVGGTAVTLLVLTQSKTVWVAALVVAAVLWVGHSPRGVGARVLLGVVVCTSALAVVLTTDDSVEHAVVDSEQAELFRTLTGRTAVWEYGLDRWSESPMFGQGASLFHDFAERTGQDWAGQAHNQYVQTLGQHGLFGLAGLLVYVVVLVRYAFRHAASTRYVSLALVAMMLTRTLTESNLDGFNFGHFAILALLLAWERNGALAQDDRDPHMEDSHRDVGGSPDTPRPTTSRVD